MTLNMNMMRMKKMSKCHRCGSRMSYNRHALPDGDVEFIPYCDSCGTEW